MGWGIPLTHFSVIYSHFWASPSALSWQLPAITQDLWMCSPQRWRREVLTKVPETNRSASDRNVHPCWAKRDMKRAKLKSAQQNWSPCAQNRLPQPRPGLPCCYLSLLSNRTSNPAPGGERKGLCLVTFPVSDPIRGYQKFIWHFRTRRLSGRCRLPANSLLCAITTPTTQRGKPLRPSPWKYKLKVALRGNAGVLTERHIGHYSITPLL